MAGECIGAVVNLDTVCVNVARSEIIMGTHGAEVVNFWDVETPAGDSPDLIVGADDDVHVY